MSTPDHLVQPHAHRRDAGLGARLLASWRRLAPLPGGRWLFSSMIGRVAPYSGTIGARVVELEPGRAELRLRERRRVRNHLRSVHAIALANLGELASGLAVMAALPAGVRGIPTALRIEFRSKARGTLRAVGTATLPPVPDADTAVAAHAEANILNEAGDVVAYISVDWQLERVP
jgi:acyl-coenzyme A thioesterase PaaI-like protein